MDAYFTFLVFRIKIYQTSCEFAMIWVLRTFFYQTWPPQFSLTLQLFLATQIEFNQTYLLNLINLQFLKFEKVIFTRLGWLFYFYLSFTNSILIDQNSQFLLPFPGFIVEKLIKLEKWMAIFRVRKLLLIFSLNFFVSNLFVGNFSFTYTFRSACIFFTCFYN